MISAFDTAIGICYVVSMKSVARDILLMGMVSCGVVYASADFSRYSIILERRPFGAPIEEPVPVPVVSDQPPPFVQHLRMVAITESPAGVRVGFLNGAVRPPRSYFLYVGESEDGILLADADFDGEKALVEKDGQKHWLRLGGAGESKVVAEIQLPSSPPDGEGRRVRRPQPSGVMRPPAAEAGSGETQDSYAERRRQRLEEMRRRAEESRQLSEAEVERQLREYQMRLIREGRTPLPIPITEEMDAQLVAEGILPAVE
jgi:hypothetical protein